MGGRFVSTDITFDNGERVLSVKRFERWLNHGIVVGDAALRFFYAKPCDLRGCGRFTSPGFFWICELLLGDIWGGFALSWT
jgi:hypothetical protein